MTGRRQYTAGRGSQKLVGTRPAEYTTLASAVTAVSGKTIALVAVADRYAVLIDGEVLTVFAKHLDAAWDFTCRTGVNVPRLAA